MGHRRNLLKFYPPAEVSKPAEEVKSMAAQPSSRPEMQCCICEDEFSNVVDLAAHLIRHAEDSAFQEEIADNGILYEEPVVADPPTTPYKSSYPEYTTMSFDKTLNTNPDPPPRTSSPIVLEIDSDSDDDASKQVVPAQPPPPQQPPPPPMPQSNVAFRNMRRGRQRGFAGGRGQ